MKIALLGNNNNIFFTLGRYLRDEGWDCDVLLFDDEYSHFFPEADTFNPESVKSFTRMLSWGAPGGFLSTSRQQIKDDLAPYDFLIGCGTAPAFVTRAGRQLDVFVPYGEDLYLLPYYTLVHPIRIPAYWAHSRAQRRGIKGAPTMVIGATNADFERAIWRIKFRGLRYPSTAPMIYHREYSPEMLEANEHQVPYRDTFKRVRENSDLVFFQHGRQLWKSPKDKWALKGNNLLIEGFRNFLKDNQGCKAHLLLYEYGKDVQHTRDLIATLRLNDAVTWLPTSPRKWIMAAMRSADVVVGELHHSWLTYGVMCEALCASKPFMHKRTDAFFEKGQNELYPMLHAASAAEVAASFQRARNEPEAVAEIGRGGHEWLLEETVRKPVAFFSALLSQAKA